MWKLVKNEQPEPMVLVLAVISDYDQQGYALMFTNGVEWIKHDGNRLKRHQSITHWQPLPPMPLDVDMLPKAGM